MLLLYAASNLSYMILTVTSLRANAKHALRRATLKLHTLRRSPFLPFVSVVVPARNESLTISQNVRALLDLDYPELEIIVVNDGSSDGTLSELQDDYRLREARVLYVPSISTAQVKKIYLSAIEPRLVVIDKTAGGCKADAVNAGVNAASGAFVCIIDADSILERDALLRIMSAVYTDTDAVVGVGGIVRVLNGCTVEHGRVTSVRLPKRGLEVLQAVEYLRSFLIGREGWSRFDLLPLISGAFGVFRTQLIREIGGLKHDAIGEDLDLVIRMHRHLLDAKRPYRIGFVPDPTCWTEVPSDWRSLSRQRVRWQCGLFQVLVRNADMLFRPRYGLVGSVLLPYLWVFELVEPLVELAGYVGICGGLLLGILPRQSLAFLLILGLGPAILISMAAVLLEELTFRRYQSWRDVRRLLLYCVLENFPYRQVHLYWRVKGLIKFFGKGPNWQPIRRRGFGDRSASENAQLMQPRMADLSSGKG